MFAAGPATNLFTAFITLLLLGGIATQFVAEDDYIHVQGIVVDGGAAEAGMQPWDTLVSIDGVAVRTTDDFRHIMSNYASQRHRGHGGDSPGRCTGNTPSNLW